MPSTIDKRLAKLQSKLPLGIQRPKEPKIFNITVVSFTYKNGEPSIVKERTLKLVHAAKDSAWRELTNGNCVYISVGGK